MCALGSLGGRELGFFRDLDLAFVYDIDDDDTHSDGPRPIPASEYAVRLAQQVLWVLTSPVAADPLYPVDTRLRPSGSHGALTTSLSRFRGYHQSESALWERQSLLRLRPVAGDAQLGRHVKDIIAATLRRPSSGDIGAALLAMRARMVKERTSGDGSLDLKLGRGGIADVEFAVQGLQLIHAELPGVLTQSSRRALSRLTRHGVIDVPTATALRLGLDRLVRVRELLQLVDDVRPAVVCAEDDRLDLLVNSGALHGMSGQAAYDEIDNVMRSVAEHSAAVLSRET